MLSNPILSNHNKDATDFFILLPALLYTIPHPMHHTLQADLHQRIANQLEQLVLLCPPDQVSPVHPEKHDASISLVFASFFTVPSMIELSGVLSCLVLTAQYPPRQLLCGVL